MKNVEKTQNSHELPNENRLMELLQQAQQKTYAELREFGIRNIAKDQFTCDFIYKPPIVSGENQDANPMIMARSNDFDPHKLKTLDELCLKDYRHRYDSSDCINS